MTLNLAEVLFFYANFVFPLTQDENKDGVFTVEELIKWIDEHKLVKFVEEDSDADMDRVVESQASSQQKDEDLSSAEPLAKKP